MNTKQSLLVQPENESELTDLEDTYSCVCLDVPMPIASEIQDLSSQEWYGESGEDVFVPSEIVHKAFDWEISCGIKASSESTLSMYFEEMLYFLSHNGKLKVYSRFVDMGKCGCYYKGASDKEYFIDSSGYSVVTFKLTFRVTDVDSSTSPDDATNPTKLE